MPIDILGAPAPERQAYDPGAVPRGRTCEAHHELAAGIAAATATLQQHEKRGDRIERTVDGIDSKLDVLGGNVARIEGAVSHGVRTRWTGKDWAVVISALSAMLLSLLALSREQATLDRNSPRPVSAPSAVTPATHRVAHP